MAEHSVRYFTRLAELYLGMNSIAIKKYEGGYTGSEYSEISKKYIQYMLGLEKVLNDGGYHVGRVYELQGLLNEAVTGRLLSEQEKTDVRVRRKAYIMELANRISDELLNRNLHK